MGKNSNGLFRDNPVIKNSLSAIDKQNPLPAYIQLAQILRKRISNGQYPPGSCLPSEAAMAKQYRMSVMTVRQAVGVIAEEGLVERMQGRGTFIRKLGVIASRFDLEAMKTVLADKENLQVRIQKASTERASGVTLAALNLAPGAIVIVVERLILHRELPFTLQTGYAPFDPKSPVVERMLDTAILTEFFLEEGSSSFKKGEVRLLPTGFDEHTARLLDAHPGDYAFKLEHVFYDFNDQPAAFGWFLISPFKMPLVGRVGVWNE